MEDLKNEFNKKLATTKERYKKDWNRIKQEMSYLISELDKINTINGQAQDITVQLYGIYLCNYYFFLIRNKIIQHENYDIREYLLYRQYENISYTPTPLDMNHFLMYLLKNEQNDYEYLSKNYERLHNIRNKMAHGDSVKVNIPLTLDEVKSFYDEINRIMKI